MPQVSQHPCKVRRCHHEDTACFSSTWRSFSVSRPAAATVIVSGLITPNLTLAPSSYGSHKIGLFPQSLPDNLGTWKERDTSREGQQGGSRRGKKSNSRVKTLYIYTYIYLFWFCFTIVGFLLSTHLILTTIPVAPTEAPAMQHSALPTNTLHPVKGVFCWPKHLKSHRQPAVGMGTKTNKIGEKTLPRNSGEIGWGKEGLSLLGKP